METDKKIWTSPDKSIVKEVLRVGTWGDTPRDGAKCKVKIYEGAIDGLECKDVPKEVSEYLGGAFTGFITIGEGDTDIDRLLDRGLQTMLLQEEGLFTLSVPQRGESRQIGAVKCRVELVGCVNEEALLDWDDGKKLGAVRHHKERGVELYRLGRIVDAFFRFSKAFAYLVTTEAGEDNKLRATLCNNMASCQLARGNHEHAAKLCDKVLALEPRNVKALYRRSAANLELRHYEACEQDLKLLLQLEPNNVAAKGKWKELKVRTKHIEEKYTEVIAKMFT